MSLKAFTSSAARRVRMTSGFLAVLFAATLWAGNSYAQTPATYTGTVDSVTGAFVALTPVGTAVGGPVSIDDAALASGTVGIADILGIDVNVGGFCFSTGADISGCPQGGTLVPIQSIDAAAITGTGGVLGGSFAITAFSPTFNVSIPIFFDLDAGTFSADGGALGTVGGTGMLEAPPGMMAPEISTTPVAGSVLDFTDTVVIGDLPSTQTIQINNTGNDALTVSAALSGASAGVTISDNCMGSVAAGGSCTVTVTLTPVAAGAVTGTVTITSNDTDEGTLTFTLDGTVLAPAALTNDTSALMPLLLDSVAVGDTSTGVITVTNAGGVGALLGTVTMPAAPFALTANDFCTGQLLAAGQDCTIEVQFAPTESGTFDTSFSVGITAPNGPNGGNDVRGVATSTTMYAASSTLDPVATPSPVPFTIADTMVNDTSTGTLTITNDGDADLIIMPGGITGLAAPFSVVSETCTMGNIAPTNTCQIVVEFAPTVEGPSQMASLSIASNDPASPLLVGVSANGTEELLPNIEVSPTTVAFATPVLIGNTDMDSVTVTNMGTADLVISSVDIAPTTDFAESSDCEALSPLAPNATCTIDVTFAPMSAGALSAAVTINSNDPGTPTTINVSGTGETPLPNIVLSTMMLDLGTATVGDTTTGMVMVSNTGSANLDIMSVAIPAGDFAQTNNCPAMLAPAGTCTVTVTFSPSSAMVITDTLTIMSNDPDAMTSVVNLTGTGVLVPEPNIISSATQIDFGSGLFGATLNGSVQISNNGNATLNISGINVTGADAAQFTAAQDCVGALAQGASCTLNAQFDPVAPAGAKTAAVEVLSDDSGTPNLAIALLGIAEMPVPAAMFSDATITFANTVVGQTATEILTISNTGTGALTVNSVSLSTVDMVYSISADTCSAVPVPVNGSCDITVAFTPNAEASFSNALIIDSDDPTTPMASIALSGNGTAEPAPDITADVMALSFGSVVFGNTDTLTVTLTNSGDADLTISSASVPAGEFTSVTMCGVLVPLATCTVEVTYAPTLAGDVTDTLTITSDDADTPSLEIALSGFGVAPQPEIEFSATALTFGPVVAGTTDAMDLTITNTGMADLTISNIMVSGTDQALFTESNDCTTLAMDESCTVTVTYAPLAAGDATALLTVESNDADEGTTEVALSGSATPIPMPMLSVPATLDLGDVNAGQTGTGTITVSNDGTADLEISSVSVAGTNAADFTQTNTCTTVAAGDTCTIDLVYTPSAPGAATADVVIASNDADNPSATVTVTANALVPVAVFSSTALDFGNVRIGESADATVTISNSGNTDLIVSGAVLAGTGAASYAVNNGCATVAAGASCAITATFTPAAVGGRSATIAVTTNDPAAATVTVTLSGTGDPMEEVVVAVKSEGGSGIGSFGGWDLVALVLFAGLMRRRTVAVLIRRAASRILPALVVLGLASAPSAMADDHEDDARWYLGAGFGSSDAQSDQGAITRGIEAAGVTVTSLEVDDTDSGFKVYGGFQATEWLAIEVGYVDLGTAGIDLQLGDVTLDQIPLISRSVSGNVSLLGSGVFGSLVARQPVTETFGVFARAGVVSWEVETAIGGGTSMGSLNIDEVESGTDYTFGLGVEAWFGQGKRFGVRGEWERFEMGGQDAEFLSLGGQFRF